MKNLTSLNWCHPINFPPQIYLKNLDTSRGQATLPGHRILPTNVNQLCINGPCCPGEGAHLDRGIRVISRLLRLKDSGKLSWRKIIRGGHSDWPCCGLLSGNIYWIGSENAHINIASPEASTPPSCSAEVSTALPVSRSTRQLQSCALWTWVPRMMVGIPSIECASMDGSRRKVLWRKPQVPVGLSFSDAGTRLYLGWSWWAVILSTLSVRVRELSQRNSDGF